MPAFVYFPCPGCRARIKAPSQLLGQQRGCPRCGQTFLVRPGQAAPAPSRLSYEPGRWTGR